MFRTERTKTIPCSAAHRFMGHIREYTQEVYCSIFMSVSSFVFLRKLQHQGIVKYFGTHLQHEKIDTKVMIVLELCKCSLKSLVTYHSEEAPARLSNVPKRTKVLYWALQVLEALEYIHDEGFVHKDLKLDNLLVSYQY